MKEQNKIKEKNFYVILPQLIKEGLRSNDVIDDLIQTQPLCGLEIFVENNLIREEDVLSVSFIDKLEDEERKLDVFKYQVIVKDTKQADERFNVINYTRNFNKIKFFNVTHDCMIEQCLDKCQSSLR